MEQKLRGCKFFVVGCLHQHHIFRASTNYWKNTATPLALAPIKFPNHHQDAQDATG